MKTLSVIFLILFSTGALWADEPMQGTFKTVHGKVLVRKHEKWIPALKDLTVIEGQRILTKEDSSAVLKLFDGSEMTIAPDTEFTLTALQKPSEDSKVIKFKLLWGKLSALVTKLTTSNSAFEIESGGVVCGVRGTSFDMFNDGKPKPHVAVNVTSGTVWTNVGSNQFIMHAGDHLNILGGVVLGGGVNGGNGPGFKKGSGNNNAGNGSSSGSGSGSSSGSTSGTATGNSTGTGNGTGTSTGTGTGTGTGNNTGAGAGTGGTTNAGLPGGSGAPGTGGPGTGSNPPLGSNPGNNGCLGDLNQQIQNITLVNTNNTITNPNVSNNTISNPVVVQALQLNVTLTVGK